MSKPDRVARIRPCLLDDQRVPRFPVIRVLEQGRRVHAWQLRHDLFVDCMKDWAGYWERAQADGRRMRT